MKLSENPLIRNKIAFCLEKPEIPFTYGYYESTYIFINLKSFYIFCHNFTDETHDFENCVKDFIRGKKALDEHKDYYEMTSVKSGQIEKITYAETSLFNDCYSYMFPFQYVERG
jgi:hypothetical protein